MTPFILLLLFNAGMLIGFVLHSMLDGAKKEVTIERVVQEPTPSSFRDDLLVPMVPRRNQYLH
jgi:hypothetical protein